MKPETLGQKLWYLQERFARTSLFGSGGMHIMSRNLSFALMALILGSVETFPSLAAADSPASTDRLGKTIAAVTVTDLSGKPTPLFAAADAKARVVVFLSLECPVSNSYAQPLAELARANRDKGVAIVGVLASEDSLADLARRAAEFKLPFPVVVDAKFLAVDALKARTTPEVFVLDAKNILRYRGRIDDAYSARLKRNATVTHHDLSDALAAILAGKPVATPATAAIGCPVTLPTTANATGALTYHRDVAPVLQAHCQTCHRPGAAGPFSLMNYKQAVTWASDIKEYTQSREMPPWKPTAGGPFRNDRHMPESDIALLGRWVDAGCPEGNPSDAKPAAKLPEGWQLGEPDLVLTPDADMHVSATGRDLFRCFPIKTGLTEDKYIVAYEVKPGNAQVVHHSLNFFDTTGKAMKLAAKAALEAKGNDERDHGPGYSVGMGIGFVPLPGDTKPGLPGIGGFGGWAPGQLPTRYPENVGVWLPKEADVVLQIHYHRTGKAETDRPKIGLYFAKKPVAKQWQTITVPGLSALSRIPPNQADWKSEGSMWITTDATIYSVMPHMHLIGQSVQVTMTTPDGKSRTLVEIKNWDYNWQETYWLETPISAPAGTRFDIAAVFNNSKSNPHNPSDPPRAVWFGEQTTNEMLYGFIGATAANTERVRMSRSDPKGSTPKPSLQQQIRQAITGSKK